MSVSSTRSLPAAILFGGLTVGALDGLAAVLLGAARDVPAVRVFQGIASGLLGRTAFEGGLATAALGLTIHFGIATTVVATYVAASRRLPALARQPWRYGPPYGIAVWAVMNLLVLPAAGMKRPAFELTRIGLGWLIHVFCVGVPAAWWAGRAGPAGETRRAVAA
jgi:hypothetical protein